MTQFRLGINYWPADTAMAWWQRFDARHVEADFSRIRDAGFDAVRLFLPWADFQPEPDRVPTELLDHLVNTCDMAGRLRLSLVVTLFMGHMSGVNWMPRWMVEPDHPPGRFPVVSDGRLLRAGIRNWYCDDEVTRAQVRLARTLAASLRGHDAVWAWDLGNEPSNCVQPPSREAGVRWLARLVEAIKSEDPGHPVTIGLHAEDLAEDRKMGPAEAAEACDFLSMHAYPAYLPWARGADDALIVPFLGLVTRWLGRRQVLMEEFGTPTRCGSSPSEPARAGTPEVPLLDEAAAASFLERALDLTHRAGLAGAMIWCYADYAPALWDRPPLNQAPHERHFGLWRSDGSPKPGVQVVRRFGWRPVGPGFDETWISAERELYYQDPRRHLVQLYHRFLACWNRGGHVQ